jgi:hypothetical protein
MYLIFVVSFSFALTLLTNIALLQIYEVAKADIVCIIGDNCSTNRSIARKWGKPLIGCRSYRFNLAVKAWIDNVGTEDSPSERRQAIDALTLLMSKASNIKAAATRLRDLTMDSRGKCLKSSTFEMNERYWKIKPDLEEVTGLEEFHLTREQNAILKDMSRVHFKRFNKLTKDLQENAFSLATARDQFDLFISRPEYAMMRRYLSPNGEIVESPHTHTNHESAPALCSIRRVPSALLVLKRRYSKTTTTGASFTPQFRLTHSTRVRSIIGPKDGDEHRPIIYKSVRQMQISQLHSTDSQSRLSPDDQLGRSHRAEGTLPVRLLLCIAT